MTDKTDPTDTQPLPEPDPKELARNLARFGEKSMELVAALNRIKPAGPAEEGLVENTSEIARTFGKVAEAWIRHPGDFLQAQGEFVNAQIRLWTTAARRALGEEVEPVAVPDRGDKRFRDADWQRNPAFDTIKQAYLITADWAQTLVDKAEDLDPHTRHKAGFYVRQIADALAPTNFPFTNPQVIRETLATNGRNLVEGIENLTEDLARGNGELAIRQTDMEAFAVGRNLALTPGKVIFQNEIFQLLQYAPATEKVFKTPLLIVPPWINKFYVLDLNPEKSMIKWLVGQGHTVFVISWVNPDRRLAEKSFDDYMEDGILTAIDTVLAATAEKKTNIVGYCVGGTLLAATLAWLAAKRKSPIKSATLLTTQVDFDGAGDLMVYVDEEQISNVEKQMDRDGYLDGRDMARAFNSLRANDLIWSYVVSNYLLGRDPQPFDLLYWNADSSRMPAANHRFYLRQCYLENRLAKCEMELCGTPLDLGKVKVPVYNVATAEDHIAPAPSVFKGGRLFGGRTEFVLIGSGHIAGVVNHPSRGKYQFWSGGTGETLDDWRATATETPGSWWPHWHDWLAGHSGPMVKARQPGGGKFEPIEDAPGSYVKVRCDE
ncbi:Polyhydroxyalkanoic acid synthase [hydrothermal vent metagenome]|uniref:Polyhydroxyalkanoic acid synthase n=1 Tax=hydrothermal vent metagenome TaxID=652676 RepID=A0A3B0UFT2_9ZZZZ